MIDPSVRAGGIVSGRQDCCNQPFAVPAGDHAHYLIGSLACRSFVFNRKNVCVHEQCVVGKEQTGCVFYP